MVVAASVGLRLAGDEAAPPVGVPVAAPLPPTAGSSPDPGWLLRTAQRTNIPARALAAYSTAALRQADDEPGCRIAWNTLAAIGASESTHGSFGGARLDARGVARPLIIGVALDGTAGNAAINDTDGGSLDRDTRWDRAVGAMQFIPTTWARWGADGDGDGRKDPHDLDDAALGAARYLCHAGGDLGGSKGWSRAVLTYNRSVPYASKVARTATTYAERL
ncbi:MAG: lytic murein transglycosylase [Flavobacterium sp.]|nr:lytic murein transglycosylase [Aeromicrobium sp.]